MLLVMTWIELKRLPTANFRMYLNDLELSILIKERFKRL